MDVDRYIAKHQHQWDRLALLVAKASPRPSGLTAGELEELVDLYQRVSAHLSHVRSHQRDRALARQLSAQLAAARQVIYPQRAAERLGIADFFLRQFPGACVARWRPIALAALVMFGPALALGGWFATSTEARNLGVDEETQQLLNSGEFEDYYSSTEAGAFAAQVQTNNIRVGFLAYAGGMTGGLLTLWLLLTNGAHLGVVAAVLHSAGRGSVFWGLVTPHGLLELSAVCLSGGAGLSLGWALIAPGTRSRSRALAEESMRSVTIALGAAVCFVIAGFIEAFVTPSGLPTPVRVGIGVLAEIGLLVWILGLGPPAVAAGSTGRFGALSTGGGESDWGEVDWGEADRGEAARMSAGRAVDTAPSPSGAPPGPSL